LAPAGQRAANLCALTLPQAMNLGAQKNFSGAPASEKTSMRSGIG